MKNNIKQNNMYKNRAFTLIETMIAVFILAMVMNGMLMIITQNLFAARYARNSIVSNYLVQEAVDYIRNDRDTIAFQGAGWDVFLDKYGYPGTKCFSANGCDIDVLNASNPVIDLGDLVAIPPPFSFGGPMFMYDETGNSKYFYSNASTTGVKSNTRRNVKMSTNGINGTDELNIKVAVEYLNGSVVKSKVYRVSLLNWKK